MRSEYFSSIRRLVIVALTTLLLLLIISNINVFLNQATLGVIIIVLSIILFLEAVTIANKITYIFITIPKEYLDSDRYLVFSKEYSELDRRELFNYYVSLELKQKLGINTYFLENFPEHIYIEFKEVGYCINTKDFGGKILDNLEGAVWDIGYGNGKYDRYEKKVSVTNPFYENKRIMDYHYNFKNKKMVNVTVISKKTKTIHPITGVYYISDFLKEFNPRK
jgi:hypothetical protein